VRLGQVISSGVVNAIPSSLVSPASLFTCGTLFGDMSTMYEPCAHGSLGEVLQIRLDRRVLTTRCSVLCGGDSRTFGNEFGELASGSGVS